jgi:hypothetical protein
MEGKPEGERLLGDHRLNWEDNIKMDNREIGFGSGLVLSDSGLGPIAGSCEHGIEASSSVKFFEFLKWLSNFWLLSSS